MSCKVYVWFQTVAMCPMSSETGAEVIVGNGLCKLTLTAPCSHLVELLEDSFTYICFTWDSICKYIREQQAITVTRCIKVNKGFTTQVFSPAPKKAHSTLPSSIFEFYPADPLEDDSPVTMASIFRFSSISKLNCQLAAYIERGLVTSTSFSENFYYHALLRGRMKHYSNPQSDCDKLVLIQLLPSNQELVPVQW